MIESLIKWTFRTLWQLVFWVYVLSFTWNGRMLYDQFKSVIVDNTLVSSIEEYCGGLYSNVKERFNLALRENQDRDSE